MTETVAIVCADVSDPYRNDTIGPPIAGRQVMLGSRRPGRHRLRASRVS